MAKWHLGSHPFSHNMFGNAKAWLSRIIRQMSEQFHRRSNFTRWKLDFLENLKICGGIYYSLCAISLDTLAWQSPPNCPFYPKHRQCHYIFILGRNFTEILINLFQKLRSHAYPLSMTSQFLKYISDHLTLHSYDCNEFLLLYWK